MRVPCVMRGHKSRLPRAARWPAVALVITNVVWLHVLCIGRSRSAAGVSRGEASDEHRGMGLVAPVQEMISSRGASTPSPRAPHFRHAYLNHSDAARTAQERMFEHVLQRLTWERTKTCVPDVSRLFRATRCPFVATHRTALCSVPCPWTLAELRHKC